VARLDLSKLNPPQREAVLHGDGPLLVLAGAGSGKTRVIAHRIARLVEKGVEPKSILAMTFTNKAAAEMRERVAKLIGEKRAAEAIIGTFHAFGLTLVRKHSKRLGFPGRIAIADSSDQTQIVRRALRDCRIDDRKFDLWRVLSLISRAKGEGTVPVPKAEGLGDDYDLAASVAFERYQRSLRAMGMVDFDDLIALPVKLLEEDAALRRQTQALHRHLLIDEYQDTSAGQLRFLKLLAGEAKNLCAVGDDDQSIYGWRGAVVQNLLGFERHFPGAKEIRLTQNYRSTGAILKCANAVIQENPARKPKELWTDRGDGEPVQLVALPGEDEEAHFVVERIAELRAQGRLLDQIAVLFRTNAQSRAFEEQLRAAVIPYDVVGGPAFFDRKDVKDLLAYLKLIANPDDEVAFLRIANVPPRGLGEATMEKLQTKALQSGGSIMAVARGDLAELGPAADRLRDFLALLGELQALFKGKGLGAAARALVERIKLREAAKASIDSPVAGQRRADAIEAVCQGLDAYQTSDRRASLAGYLARLALDGRGEEAAPGDGGRVVLMTLHSAKGLEFPVVFLVGLEEDLLPHGGMQGQPRDLEEERRLCYVGITRAREQLTLTRASARQRRGQTVPRTPSRFLEALPPEQVRVIDLAAKATPGALAASRFWETVGLDPAPEG
jgi:DNA helicase-2/ATP-dependent DNA helicase PcrA